MKFQATKAKVYTRGVPPDDFLTELVTWGVKAPEEIFAPNDNTADVYAVVKPELGPYPNMAYRRAVMLEVMRVLAGFEATWRWGIGADTTRVAKDTPLNKEAGIFQVSADSLNFGPDLRRLVMAYVGSLDPHEFQHAMKTKHELAFEYVARLMRHTMKHNGPLYRDRAHIQEAERPMTHSIFPWISRDAVNEFGMLLAEACMSTPSQPLM
jgi:hypothetical protein